jgi:gas vesicle protein
MNFGNVLVGVVAGTVVGGALGLLFAPEKGVTTRKNITDKSKKYSHALESNYNDVVEGLAHKFDSVKETGKDLAMKA